MPGTIIFKPIQANLTRDLDLLGKMDPYCLFIVGKRKYKGEVCKSGGTHPFWNDFIAVPRINQPTCVVELRDKDIHLTSDTIGACEINLDEIEACGKLSKWYPVVHSRKLSGQILIESTFLPETPLSNEAREEAKVQSPVLQSKMNYDATNLGKGQTIQQRPAEQNRTSLNQPEEFERHVIFKKEMIVEKQLPEDFSNQNLNIPVTTSVTCNKTESYLHKFPQRPRTVTSEQIEVKPYQRLFESSASRGLAKAWGENDHSLKDDIGRPLSELSSVNLNYESGSQPVGHIYEKH